jgi:hypothetical protein
MAVTNYPAGGWTSNTNQMKNPPQIKFLNAQMSRDTTSSGVGPDLVYRDPWGNPYIISLDLDYDDRCLDAFYGLQTVSQPSGGGTAGIYGLFNSTDANGNGNHFQFNGGVMVWSLGPNKIANRNVGNLATQKADSGDNKDNVLSWKQ